MEHALAVVFEPDCCTPQKDLRRHARRPVNFPIIVGDKSGIAKGQVLDLSPVGVGCA
jgi:hypothetical protein